jgi:competence protein ComEC
VPSSWTSHTTASGRLSLLAAASFAAGVLLPGAPLPGRGALLALVLLLLSLILARPGRKRLVVAVAALGAGVIAAAVDRAADPVPALLARWRSRGFQEHVSPMGIRGRVIDVETQPDGRITLLVRLERVTLAGGEPEAIHALRAIRARLTIPVSEDRSLPAPCPGDFVEMSARIGPPRSFRNPGGFDYGAYLGARRIPLVGSVKSARLVRIDPERYSALTALLPGTRQAIVRALDRAAGGQGGSTVPLLAALLVGEREELPDDFEESLVRAGVYHIIALSGFNVALVAGIVSGLIRLLHPPPWSRRLFLGLVVLIYWAVACSSGSMSRAALMALLQIAGAALGRRVSGIGAMASSLVILLAAGPGWIDDAGFQLSFAATFGILIVPSPRVAIRGGMPAGRAGIVARAAGAVRRALGGSLRVSAAALAGTALLSARHFQTLTPIALAANLIAVPLAAALLVLAAVAAILDAAWHGAAAALIAVCGFLAQGLQRLCAFVALVPWGSFYVIPPSWPVVVLGLIALAAIGGRRPAGRRAAMLLLLGAIALTAVRGRMPRPTGRLEVVALDVGQGDAIVVRFPNGETMLVDAGGFARSSFDVGSRVVAPALRGMGILRLDILAITHAHRDHLGGAPAIVRQMGPAAIWLGRMPRDDPAVGALVRLAARLGIAVLQPRGGVRVGIGGSVVEVLNPGGGAGPASGVSNDDSLVLRLGLGGRHALLTGDLEKEGEAMLIGAGRDLAAELLKVPHHGSRTSSTGEFLRRVRPRMAAISVGAANPWGHPDREVIERLEAGGIVVLRTDRDGAVRFSTDGSSPWIASPLTGEGGGRRGALRESARSE